MRHRTEPKNIKPTDWATPEERDRHRSRTKCLEGCAFCLEEKQKQKREEEAALRKSLRLPPEKDEIAQ